MATVTKTIVDRTGKFRICISQRPDGLFQYLEEEYRLLDEEHSYWSWRAKWPPSGIFESMAEAETAARAHVSWLAR